MGDQNNGGGCTTQFQTVCSQSSKNQCSTTFVSQCSNEAVTTYEEECKVEIVGTEPAEICTTEIQEVCEEAIETSYKTECTSTSVSECSTTYVRECYRGRKKRGLLQALLLNQALNQRNPVRVTTEAPQREAPRCRNVPRQTCTDKPQQTCRQVPVQSKTHHCRQVESPVKRCEPTVSAKKVTTCKKVPVQSERVQAGPPTILQKCASNQLPTSSCHSLQLKQILPTIYISSFSHAMNCKIYIFYTI